MIEYTIEIQHGKSKPFSLHTFNNFDLCYAKLLQIINTDRVRKEYYVLNDFYDNVYSPYIPNLTFYTIKVRSVTEWEIYSRDNSIKKGSHSSNVINLF